MISKRRTILFDNRQHTLEENLAQLAEITQSFAATLNIQQTLQNAIQQMLVYMDAEAASIFLLENNDTELVCRECAGPVNITGLRLQAGQGIVGKTVSTKHCQLVRDVSKDPNFSQSVDKNTGFVTKSILCAPLLVQGSCIGALELINKRNPHDLFDRKDEHLLLALAAAAALAIHNATMATALIEQERMRKELELAREIQLTLLPSPYGEDFPVAGVNFPAREVSGDFYDYFRRADGRIYFNLADVSGKGLNSALLMTKASSLLRHLAKTITDPGELLARVNDELCETVTRGMFITIVSGFIDTEQAMITLANAGHQPLLYHHHDGRFEEIPAEAPPLCIQTSMSFPVTTFPMEGGSLYLYTDGVTESLDENDRPLNIAGLIDLIQSNPQPGAAKRLENIITRIRRPGVNQRDDITLMVIDCSPRAVMQHILKQHYQASPNQLVQIRQQVRQAVELCGCNADLTEKLVLAVNEACMNVIQHAYRGDHTGEITLEILNNDNKLQFRIEDYAAPVNLSSVRPRDIDDLRPGGLGTHFIREIMDDFKMGHLEDDIGNYLEMTKKIN
jgi:sigma-B regulation protein RsbU (phosphoserine phosphatase)